MSKPSLHFLLGFGLFGLILSGYSFVKNVELVFYDIESSIAPALVIHTKKPAPPPFTEVPKVNLSLGDVGVEVLLLQEFLTWKGLWPEGEELTGYFGEMTREVVRRYQKSKNISPEGRVGPLTRKAWQADIDKALK